MKRRLYSNMKHMTTLFCIAIVCVTLTSLLLRLTVFSDMAVYASNDLGSLIEGAGADQEDSQFHYRIAESVKFSNAGARGKIGISNLSEEHYLKVTVIEPDTQDAVIYTGFIRPGESRDEVTLDIPLAEGSYECLARIEVCDSSNLGYPIGTDVRPITVQVG